ncbi:hypothetical protein P171DRAFT_435226 [Karstenula rhodostoma CBS 690.94]|uniref:Uncharacterized protein n=1 Tax=Karstenula rhodostoma CBS 690.94 TaxID=1392251 RepID=A0A9P4PC18_9PLEO|nr:hypothetical protein P171DRAFT_435226 [Karstenula rhodostoma CBS 690.94]
MGSEGKRTSSWTTPSLSSESASPTAVNFLALPIGIRKKIYKRVLLVSHPLYLSQEPGSRVETFAPEKPNRWLAILYTNRQIYHEASAALYGTNHFQLVDTTEQQVHLLRSFLDCIGAANADSLSHLSINFPVTESIHGQPGRVELREDSLQTLQLLRDSCTNLSTLETLVHSKNSDVFKTTDDSLQEALSLIDARFKGIPSLRKIVVRFFVYDGVPSATAKDIMQGLGWVLLSGDRDEHSG